ncbi:MAG: S26 family signal peptidase [Thermoplasmata archaeon]
MENLEKQLKSIGKDVLISLVILIFILGILFVYSGRWPPLVVIESSSMSHGTGDPPDSQIGVIDTGDIVIVKETSGEDIITYVEGKAEGYKTYGQYGDVLIYKALGKDKTPIIHRPVLYLIYNDGAFDIPSLKNLDYGEEWTLENEVQQGDERWNNLTGSFYIHDYGYANKDIKIDLEPLLKFKHSGYITMGDHNPKIDQNLSDPICAEPVKNDWVEGKARGELPWFGILKLITIGKTSYIPQNSWYYLFGSLSIILISPFLIEYSVEIYKRKIERPDSKNGGSRDNHYLENNEEKNESEKIKEKRFDS